MKLRLMGTEAECARLAFLLRFGPPGLEVLGVDGPYPNRGDSDLVRAYLEVRLEGVNPLVDRTFYSLVDREGRPALVDAWGNIVEGDDMETTERRAEPGELCTCGQQAIVVYLSGALGPTGWCGIGDGGDRTGPCPFCGGPRHTEL